MTSSGSYDYGLYVDFMSQPSRACVILSRLNRLIVKENLVLVHKKQQKSDKYKKLNPLQQVPLFVESRGGRVDFVLPESCAILTHLCTRFDLADHWYPRSRQGRAYVDSALHWFHSTLRKGCGGVTFHKVVAYNLGVKPVEAIALDSKQRLERALQQLEDYWLKGKTFVGGKEPNVADLLFVCELEQLHMLHLPTDGIDIDGILNPFPRVEAWMRDVAEATSPVYEDVHKLLRYAAKKRHQKLNQKKLKPKL